MIYYNISYRYVLKRSYYNYSDKVIDKRKYK